MGRNEIIRSIFLILLISLPLFFFRLDTPGLTDRDEGSFSEATREMLESGNWLTPKFNYNNRFDKPILIYYVMALPYKLFGINEFAARFHSAFFGTLLLLLVFFFVKDLKGIRTALLSSVILASNLAIVILSRAAITDMVLIFLITASLFSFYKGLWIDRKWSWGFYIFSALAVLTKGPVGIIIPLLVIILYLISLRGKGNLKELHLLGGTSLFLLISLPWFLIMLVIHGNEYIEAAKYHTLTRYSSVIGGHGGMIFYYIPVILIGFFPWSAFLPASIYYAIKESWKRRWESGGHSLFVFSIIWILVVFVFFTSSKTKLPHYIGPLFPPMAILVADLIDRYISEERIAGVNFKGWVKVSLYIGGILGVLFSAVLATAGVLSHRIVDIISKEIPVIDVDFLDNLFIISAIIFIGTLSFICLSIKGAKRTSIAFLVIMMVIMIPAMMLTIVPTVDSLFLAPQRRIAAFAGLNLRENERFIVFGFYRPTLVFYSKRKVVFIRNEDVDKLRKELSQPGNVFVLCRESSMKKLESEGERLKLISRENGYILLSNEKSG
ncbi:MAG: glycosyltransferase family 39 protein [Nitrospirota bacterium]